MRGMKRVIIATVTALTLAAVLYTLGWLPTLVHVFQGVAIAVGLLAGFWLYDNRPRRILNHRERSRRLIQTHAWQQRRDPDYDPDTDFEAKYHAHGDMMTVSMYQGTYYECVVCGLRVRDFDVAACRDDDEVWVCSPKDGDET